MKRIALVLCCALSGCAYRAVLVPTGNAEVTEDGEAVTSTAGIEVTVDGAAWNAQPLDLYEVMSPVQLTVVNRSDRPLRLMYRDFTLSGSSGMRYAALSPLQARGAVPVGEAETPLSPVQPVAFRGGPVLAQPPLSPAQPVAFRGGPTAVPVHRGGRVHGQSFYVAPQYGTYYPGYPVWGSAFPYEPYAYGPYAWPEPLPTQDMLAQALPEGVLQPGGTVEGFVYFQGVTSREQSVSFEMRLVDARTQESFGVLSVPMQVQLQ